MKPTFAKLSLKLDNNIKTIVINEQEIEVKQYLPINDKLDLISTVINLSMDDNNFANPVKVQVYTKLEILFRYTNLSFTDKQKDDLVKIYDLLESNHIFDLIIAEIPESEYKYICESTEKCVKEIYAYSNSIMGVLERLSADYSQTSFDMDALKTKLENIGDVSLLQDIVDKLG